MKPGILTLTTDFGIGRPLRGGDERASCWAWPRDTQIVDVSHTISPQNILEGAFVLAGIVDSFPAGTVHLVVIDPGVGTDRRLIAARLADQWFVLPDNGLITGVARTHHAQRRSGRSPIRRSAVPWSPTPSTAATSWRRPRPTCSAAATPPSSAPPVAEARHAAELRTHPRRVRLRGRGDLPRHFGNLITNLNATHLARPSRRRLGRRDRRGDASRACREPTARSRPAPRWHWWAARAGSRSPSSMAMRPGMLTAGAGTTVWFRRPNRSNRLVIRTGKGLRYLQSIRSARIRPPVSLQRP